MTMPKGFSSFSTSMGIKDDSLDFGAIFSETPANFASLFTQNQVKGNPILYGERLVKIQISKGTGCKLQKLQCSNWQARLRRL